MGFFKNVLKNPASLLLGVPGALIAHNREKQNQRISDQIQNPGAPPEMLNPNQMPGMASGLSAYGQLHRQLNAMDAQRMGEEQQAGIMGDTAQARSQLATSGGLSSGANERLARGGMQNAAAARQGNAYGLMRQNMATDTADIGNQQSWAQTAHLKNQETQANMYAGNRMANATLDANRPKKFLGIV